MRTLIGKQPSAMHHVDDATLFYFGSQSSDVYLLPAYAIFEVVCSPKKYTPWEVIQCQMMADKNGISVINRRPLQADEVSYFEGLLSAQLID